MIYQPVSALLMRQTSQETGEDPVEAKELIWQSTIPGWYGIVKGANTNTDWPVGAGQAPLNDGFVPGGGPNWDTFSESGIDEWSIEQCGHVPGILQVGYWTADNLTDVPDSEDEFTLDSSGWGTGPLWINEFDSSAPGSPTLYIARYRYFPAHMETLM